ncbi:uncharacterized protein LOC144132405 isoform X4 [Amblyomma americanum]
MAPVVLVAKVLPRCFASTDAEASLRLLNRKLTAALKRMPCVGILNPDHRLLDAMKAPKRHLFATDGHHLSAGEAIEELAEVFVRGLAKFYGAGILAPFSGAPASSAEMRSTLPNQAGRGWSLTRCEWDTATNSAIQPICCCGHHWAALLLPARRKHRRACLAVLHRHCAFAV